MSSSDLVFYVQLQVKPECVQEWKEAVIEVINHMSAELTFVTCYLHQDIRILTVLSSANAGVNHPLRHLSRISLRQKATAQLTKKNFRLY
jgi:hypothetical protein